MVIRRFAGILRQFLVMPIAEDDVLGNEIDSAMCVVCWRLIWKGVGVGSRQGMASVSQLMWRPKRGPA
jgi:hypothetical protein